MTIGDAFGIFYFRRTKCSDQLPRKTYTDLQAAFAPKVRVIALENRSWVMFSLHQIVECTHFGIQSGGQLLRFCVVANLKPVNVNLEEYVTGQSTRRHFCKNCC